MEGKMAGKVVPRMKGEVNPMRGLAASESDFEDRVLEGDKELLVLSMRNLGLVDTHVYMNVAHP